MDLKVEAPYDGTRLIRTLAEFRAAGRMDLAFGGPVLPNASAVQITGLHGNRTRALAGLRVQAGYGLGGKALTINRPVSVAHYATAQGITHTYDRPVSAEHLETVAALPISIDGTPRMLIYLASRTQLGLGDRWYDTFIPLVRRVERDLAVDAEVRRRLAQVAVPPAASASPASDLTRADLHDIADELADLASLIDDEALRARLERVRSRVTAGEQPSTRSGLPAVRLAAREIDVLEQIAHGRTNRQVAEQLGLEESTVKSYLKNAMRKLHASNRVHAIALAREAGVIR